MGGYVRDSRRRIVWSDSAATPASRAPYHRGPIRASPLSSVTAYLKWKTFQLRFILMNISFVLELNGFVPDQPHLTLNNVLNDVFYWRT